MFPFGSNSNYFLSQPWCQRLTAAGITFLSPCNPFQYRIKHQQVVTHCVSTMASRPTSVEIIIRSMANTNRANATDQNKTIKSILPPFPEETFDNRNALVKILSPVLKILEMCGMYFRAIDCVGRNVSNEQCLTTRPSSSVTNSNGLSTVWLSRTTPHIIFPVARLIVTWINLLRCQSTVTIIHWISI